MLKDNKAFSGFSVNDLKAAQNFYGQVLGLDTDLNDMGLELKLAGGNNVFLYQKDDHQPATFTVLNFVVDSIDAAVDELTSKGVKFEKYEGLYQDEKGIGRGIAAKVGPDIAWFKDPAGNILSVLQES